MSLAGQEEGVQQTVEQAFRRIITATHRNFDERGRQKSVMEARGSKQCTERTKAVMTMKLRVHEDDMNQLLDSNGSADKGGLREHDEEVDWKNAHVRTVCKRADLDSDRRTDKESSGRPFQSGHEVNDDADKKNVYERQRNE